MAPEPGSGVDQSPGDRSARPVRHDYLEQLLQAMWPAPARISRPGRLARRSSSARDYVAVPNDLRPKLLLPRHPHRVTAAGLRNYKSSARGRNRLKLQVLATMTRFGAADLLPSRVRIETGPVGSRSGIDDYLSSALDRELYVCIYIGVARAVQKPVLQLLSPAGVTFGFAKVGTNSLTRRLVRSEGESLQSLAAHPWTRLRIPSVLHQGEWNGHQVLVQEALTSTEGAGAFDSVAMTEAMVELSSARGVTSGKVTDSPYWQGLRQRLSALPPSPYVEIIDSTLSQIEPAADAVLLDFGSWHGDFAPWNMSFSGARVNVWDWEQFETGVPLGYDALHFHAQRALVRDSRDSHEAMDSALLAAPELLAPFGIEPSAAGVVGLLYLVEIALRYLQDGEVDAGTRMGRLQSWLEPVTTRQLERLERGVPQ
jgi:hypothetical protein